MKKFLKIFIIISEILILLGFLSGHFLIAIYYTSSIIVKFGNESYWILSDIFVYSSILLQLIVIGLTIGVDYK